MPKKLQYALAVIQHKVCDTDVILLVVVFFGWGSGTALRVFPLQQNRQVAAPEQLF